MTNTDSMRLRHACDSKYNKGTHNNPFPCERRGAIASCRAVIPPPGKSSAFQYEAVLLLTHLYKYTPIYMEVAYLAEFSLPGTLHLLHQYTPSNFF